ncbi:MAG: flagellar basal-body rod protein FlgF [Magnetococcus sp. DMHC-6]
MDSGLYATVNGALRTEMRMDVLANNLANVNTTGFKEDNITFDSYLTSPGIEQFPLPTDSFMGLRAPGDISFPFTNPASNAYRMTYPRADGTHVNLEQGAMQQTNNPLHVALEGKGFFVLDTPDGRRYTRDGSFRVNPVGELTSKDGFPVLGAGNAPLVVGDAGPIHIAEDGTITGSQGNIGRLQRVDLPPESLEKVGLNLYSAPQGAEIAMENSSEGIHQGFLEGSNANMIRSMTNMIDANRAMETYQKMIQALDSMDNQAANQIGSLK